MQYFLNYSGIRFELPSGFRLKFCFCLILRHKAFLTVLVNIYNVLLDVVIFNEHIPQDIPFL